MSYLDRIRACNRYDLSDFVPFRVGTVQTGWVRRGLAGRLRAFDGVFAVEDYGVVLNPRLEAPEARTEAVGAAVAALADEGVLARPRGEMYRVAAGFCAPTLFELDRAAVSAFGIRAYGLHVNGFVRGGEAGGGASGRDLRMWIGRRAADRPTYPGERDNMVAGGQPAGLGLAENLVKEAAEEAAIPEALARTAMPVGAITYCCEESAGLKPDTLFCWDLELPAGFEPRNTDGEIAGFELLPVEEVARIVRETAEFKFNCNLVIVDFLVRHGLIGPDEPDYLQIVAGLRPGTPPGFPLP